MTSALALVGICECELDDPAEPRTTLADLPVALLSSGFMLGAGAIETTRTYPRLPLVRNNSALIETRPAGDRRTRLLEHRC